VIASDVIPTIEAVRARHPMLAWYGFGPVRGDRIDFRLHRAAMTESWQVEQFLRAVEWLEQAKRTRIISRRRTSYGWKHVAERWLARRSPGRDPYIADGMFIAAAIHLGFLLRPLRNGTSVWLNIAAVADDCH
jgi:hypothetical protein